jgi:hypothetical protein
MVNELQQIRAVVVKADIAPERERVVTSHGGHSLVQAVGRQARFVSDARRYLPRRRDERQGFTTASVALALTHGLLAGGRGFSATEAMRGDGPLLAMLGLERAPSAETVEEVVKYLGDEHGRQAATPWLRAQARRQMRAMSHGRLRGPGGFVFAFIDGSLLEVRGRRFDAIKTIKGGRGQMCVAAMVGRHVVALDFARSGEGEEAVGRRMIGEVARETLRPMRLVDHTLVVMDSLYGDGPTLDAVESERGLSYIIGVNGLDEAQRAMGEASAHAWRAASDRDDSDVAQMWLQCEDWAGKRTMVCRRWREPGEMIWRHAAVATNLTVDHPRVARLMGEKRIEFEEAIWLLYNHKQAKENLWKEMLTDLGLHHPPCARSRVNAVFYTLAAAAYNLSAHTREVALVGKARRMRLWRFRREVLSLAGRVARHGRQARVTILDARHALVERFAHAMKRLDRLLATAGA